ncbi:MAG: SET domain-containing protein-lysine N-methyltransferase [Proteobacteria bacterium]|nr:SET domain-containing protein-lysine N-methyltransferase [Pseudomonadota bacterium]
MSKYAEASLRTKTNVSANYSDDYVYVSESKYLNKLGYQGNGLYANQTFNAGDIILEYKGKKITDHQAELKKSHKQYMFDVKDGKKVLFVIDGANNRFASAAKYTNTTRTFASRQRNSEFIQYNKKIYLVASKKIRQNTEIITYYGNDTDRVINSK